MIFLTGDVHNMSLKALDQEFLNITELEAALKFARIASKYSINFTLFISGRAFLEERDTAEKLSSYKNLEIGGHTWDSFRYSYLHDISNLLFSTYYGPKIYQKWDIKKTIKIIEDTTGDKVLSWRTHSYRSDNLTKEILSDIGIRVISEEHTVNGKIRYNHGLIYLPINTPEDHTTIIHGYREKEFVQRLNYARHNNPLSFCKRFGNFTKLEFQASLKYVIKKIKKKDTKKYFYYNNLYNINEWGEWIKQIIKDRIKEVGFATLVIHPVCMEIADGMRTYEDLCRFISQYDTYKAKDLLILLKNESLKNGIFFK